MPAPLSELLLVLLENLLLFMLGDKKVGLPVSGAEYVIRFKRVSFHDSAPMVWRYHCQDR